MNSKFLHAIAATVLLTAACGDFVHNSGEPTRELAAKNVALTGVADFSGMQVTGVTVSDSGRTFANFPRWRDGVAVSVVEIKADGTWAPYPDASWNVWTGTPRLNSFTCVQSIIAFQDSLFVLDPSSPNFQGVMGSAALYEFDLKTNLLKNTWKFTDKLAPPRSYLSDLVVDGTREVIYISDSGLGAILVLDIKTGLARRVLEESPSTKSQAKGLVRIGYPIQNQTGRPTRVHSDGLALFDGYLYFQCTSGSRLYRVPTDVLTNPRLSSTAVAQRVEDLGTTPLTGGMVFDKFGNLFMGDHERNAIVYRTPTGEMRTLVRDFDLHWIDALAITPADELIFTDSRIDLTTPAAPVHGKIFSIYKVALPK